MFVPEAGPLPLTPLARLPPPPPALLILPSRTTPNPSLALFTLSTSLRPTVSRLVVTLQVTGYQTSSVWASCRREHCSLSLLFLLQTTRGQILQEYRKIKKVSFHPLWGVGWGQMKMAQGEPH